MDLILSISFLIAVFLILYALFGGKKNTLKSKIDPANPTSTIQNQINIFLIFDGFEILEIFLLLFIGFILFCLLIDCADGRIDSEWILQIMPVLLQSI